jgi:hypothetical protein
MITRDQVPGKVVRELFAEFLEQRVDRGCECPECGGLGVKTYGDTSTWRAGVGGQAFTRGACDRCWGSGNRHRPWPSHREFEALKGASR